MDRIDAMKVFVATLDEGSLAGASRRLGRSPAAVSRAIAFLEEHVGTALLHRTTRTIKLSEDELGKLNDIVSSEALLLAHADRLGEPGVVDDAIAYLRHRKGQHMQRADAELRALSDRLALERPGAGLN